jgi:hypothetical protein
VVHQIQPLVAGFLDPLRVGWVYAANDAGTAGLSGISHLDSQAERSQGSQVQSLFFSSVRLGLCI